ncbi:hypothetical protein BDZ94DRAFT_1287849 [Collybia nuda]|uniref:non-specific serine/threonine protein kinase n=1 Tax=Collybia nuda TaxID=64659 RepID=A0A9P6CNY5_9AGAR|nr:hypothetical protein BDZ94DRAFT_1287849 [Collybia nuda]
MTPTLYLSILLFTLTAICLGEIVSLRSLPGRSKALVERGNAGFEQRLIPSDSEDKPDLPGELGLLDVVLVASVDGKFHALNRTSGNILWSMTSFPSSTSISAPATLSPLVRTNHVDHDPDLTDESSNQELYVVEPQSGDIYVMATPTSPLQRFPFSMSELVDLSPFTFAGTEDGRLFVGRKETSLLLIELETGKVKATLNSECPWDPSDYQNEADSEVDLDELDGSQPRTSARTEVFIGRTDYYISILPGLSRKNSALQRAPIQNLSFSAYGPNNRDNYLQASYKRTKDDRYIQSLPSGDILSFKGSSNEKRLSGDSHLLWMQHFTNPIVAIFDVLYKNPSTSNAMVLLQPRPQLQDVLPNLTPETSTARLPNLNSAYVGIVKETGSLFAMTPGRYPLVAFGGAERHSRSHLIDAPTEDNDLPVEVDDITRARKYKERMEAWERERCQGDTTDRRCLVGIRKLEDSDGPASRMKRLLDGPIDGRFPALLPGRTNAQPVEGAPNNETIPVPTGIGDSSNVTRDTVEGWTKAARGNLWEALAITFVIGIISLWFAVKRLRNKKSVVTATEKEPAKIIETPIANTSNGLTLPTTPSLEPFNETLSLSEKDLPLPPKPPKPESPVIKSLPLANGNIALDGDESEKEGEGEGDIPATPGRRKVRRGKRGKKKKAGVIPSEDGSEEKTPVESHTSDLGNKDSDNTPSSLIINSPKPSPSVPSLIVSDTILGFGSHGTVVFQGSLQGRAVAVKRLLQDFVTLASREVSILQDSDDHPNVIRYYYQEAHANFLYIALELCPGSLADIVECPDRDQWRDIAINFDPKKALKQITSGLRHLHALKLVHRDIKPQNILVSGAKPPVGGVGKPTYRMLISDFGLCKRLDVDQTSFLPTAQGAMGAGTVGWRAPEILRGDVRLDEFGDDHSMSSRGSTGTVIGTPTATTGKPTRLTKSVDIFALGCLFFYTLTNGGHPFGDRFEREVNILKNAKNLEALERFGEEGAEAADLITAMLDPEAYERPDTTTCLLHPFFWDPGRRLNFLQDASDRFEIMCRDPKDPYLLTLERDAFSIVGNDWQARLDKIFIENLGKFRKYDGRSVQDLLRALRNKKHHYQDLPDNVKRHLGPMPEGFLSYFTRRYPRLFLHVHSVIGTTGLRSESMFRSYFELPE